MTRRLIVAAALALTLGACGPWVPPPFAQRPAHYCFNEPTVGRHGQTVNHFTCVSPGSPGSLGR